MFFKSKITLAAAAVCALFSTPAAAEVEQINSYGPFIVLADSESAICALGVGGSNGDVLTIIYHHPSNLTLMQYENPQYGNMTGRPLTVDLYVDSDKYSWTAVGEGKGLVVRSTDPDVPSTLIDATVFGMGIDGQLMFSVNSDDNFDAAMSEVVICSIILSQ